MSQASSAGMPTPSSSNSMPRDSIRSESNARLSRNEVSASSHSRGTSRAAARWSQNSSKVITGWVIVSAPDPGVIAGKTSERGPGELAAGGERQVRDYAEQVGHLVRGQAPRAVRPELGGGGAPRRAGHDEGGEPPPPPAGRDPHHARPGPRPVLLPG